MPVIRLLEEDEQNAIHAASPDQAYYGVFADGENGDPLFLIVDYRRPPSRDIRDLLCGLSAALPLQSKIIRNIG